MKTTFITDHKYTHILKYSKDSFTLTLDMCRVLGCLYDYIPDKEIVMKTIVSDFVLITFD